MSLQALIEHHLERANEGATFNALANCHARGLHSIVLHDAPENRVRLFFADDAHELDHNKVTSGEPFSIGIHAHHCDLRLVGLFGRGLESHQYGLIPHAGGDFREYTYASGVNGPPAMEPTGARAHVRRIAAASLGGRAIRLAAHELHTIYLPYQQPAAWLVLEGGEDPDYQPRCWSNAPPESFDFDGLYQPMQPRQVCDVLSQTLRWMP